MKGQISKRGDAWLLTVFEGRDPNGKKLRYTQTVYGPKKHAQGILTELVAAKNRGETLKSYQTVDKLLDEWFKHLEQSGKVRARTLHSYRTGALRYIRATRMKDGKRVTNRSGIGAIILAKLAPSDIVRMMMAMKEAGLGAVTIRKAREVVRNALSYAMMRDLISTNPAKHELVKASLPKVKRAKRQTITADGVKAFHAATEGEKLRAYWLLLLWTGLRPSEALALKWPDLDGNAVQIERSLTDNVPHGKGARDVYELAEPKSETSRRTVVLPRFVVEALKVHRAAQRVEREKADTWHIADFIFCNAEGLPLRQQDTRRSFTRILDKAKLPHMRPYDLRHSAASIRLEMGDDLHDVKELLGHSSIILTSNTYGHGTRRRQQESVDKLDKRFA